MSDAVYGYFQQFGEVELIEWNQSNDGLVQFKREESAKAVLSQSNHFIGPIALKAVAADDCLQPDFELILRELDDDCLTEIFSRLKLLDLCNAAEVCVRFRNAANRAFMRNFKSMNLLEIRADCNEIPMRLGQLQPMIEKLQESVLRNFGPLIHSLTGIETERTLKLIDRYCVDKSNNLKELEFWVMKITRKVVERFRNVFKNLTKLTFHKTKIDKDIDDFFPLCTELEHLYFGPSNETGELLNNLLISNPKLTKLSVSTVLFEDERPLDEYLRKPSKLGVCFNYQYLTNFRMLVELDMDFGYQFVTPVLKLLVEHNSPIRNLCLVEGVMDIEVFETLSQMKQISHLYLYTMYSLYLNENHLVKLIKELPELQKLSLSECSIEATTNSLKRMISCGKKLKSIEIEAKPETKIELNEYNTMLEIVKSRNLPYGLEIEISGAKIEVPKDILLKNSSFFKLV